MLQERTTRSALGRLGCIGELYDVRTDSFSSRSLFRKNFPSDLIMVRDMQQMEFEYKFTESISDRFEMLNVEAELQLSVLLGLLSLEGSGRYLTDDKKSQAAVSCALICKLLNISEKLFSSFEEIVPYIDLSSLQDPQQTHVIVEINWGANCLLNLESNYNSSTEKQEIKGAFAEELKKLKFILAQKGSGDLQKEKSFFCNNNNIHIKILADVVPDNGWPTTVEGFCQFVLELPKLLKKVNNGKGKPLSYVMIPLSNIRKLARVECNFDVIVKKIDESFLMSIVFFFEEVSQTKQKFHDVLEVMSANKKYVKDVDLKKIKEEYEKLLVKESELKSLISEDWVLVKSGEKNLKDLIRKVEKFKSYDLNIFRFQDFLESCESALKKISLVNNYISRGIIYLGQGDSLDIVMAENLTFEFVILLISSEIEKADPELYRNSCLFFLAHASESEPNTKHVVLDFDFKREEKIFNREIKKAKCFLVKGTNILSSDLYSDYMEDLEKNFAQMTGNAAAEFVVHKPANRVVLEIRCPGFENNLCTPDSLKWSCVRCKNYLEYGFDKNFYCSCGKGSSYSYQFRCKNPKHGLVFLTFNPEVLDKALLSLKPLKELNVLVLGQSGVGKSTWINSIINYLTYDSLDTAQENGAISTIPMSYVLYDSKTLKKHVINVGKESNRESTEVGESGTQHSHTYSFLWEDKCVRIIDTPGLGDTRGIDQDKKNLENVIQHIGYLKEIHGVCILFRANENRNTSYFTYCLKELLANMHKSVTKNIVFCFTNARNSMYSPGQVSAILEKVIADLGIEKELPLGYHNMFCLDNEALLFLCSLDNSEIHHDEKLLVSYAQSWDISLSETKRLFNTIKKFEPHLLKETVSLVTARRQVLTLTKPLADISKTILMNVAAMEKKKKEITASETAIEKLSKKLKVTEIHLELEPLEKPRTVCTSPRCVEYITYQSSDFSDIEYKTHCHVECLLIDVTPKTVNNSELKHCTAMNNGICKYCNCSWSKHMHLTYNQIRVEKLAVNKSIEKDLLKEKTEKEQVESFVNELKKIVEKYELEQEIIIQTCVKFGMFLQNNAISLYNDSVEDYLNYLIHVEESKLQKSETEKLLLLKMKETLEHYKAEVKIIEEVIRKGQDKTEELTVQDIYELEQNLYKLELTGESIRKSVEMNRLLDKKMMEYNETHLNLHKNCHKRNKKKKSSSSATEDSYGMTNKMKKFLINLL